MTNLPDVNAVQQFNTPSAAAPQGDNQLTDSKFASLVNKEIKSHEAIISNHETTNAPADSSNNAQTKEASDANPDKPDKAPCQCVQSGDKLNNKDESVESGEDPVLKNGSENGLKIGEILMDVLNIAATVAISPDDSQINLVNKTEDSNVTGEQAHPLESITGPEVSAESGLKMGALLSDLMKAAIAASAKDPNGDPIAQSSSEAANKGEEGGSENKKATGDIKNAGDLLAALTQGDKKEPADTDVNKLLKQAAEHADKCDTEINSQRPANSQDGSADLNSQGGRKGPEDFQNKTQLEIVRGLNNEGGPKHNADNSAKTLLEITGGLNNADGPKHNADNSAKTIKVELPADSVNLLNQSNVKIEAGKPVEGAMPANAARQAELNQILDKVVYVVKGNKLGVTLKHDNLGKLDINLSMEKGVVNVQINTSERVVRDYIENNIQYIVDSLAKDGVSVGGFSVALKDNRDNEQNVFVINNKQGHDDGEVIKREAKISPVSGLVSVFA
ncbi:MAG: flagellar hook-length control protein FliK [Nitrospirae bacterium]|nr:flagellar hook-length control protein FliK [Nitrospirota bacterium]